ncbi:MAG: 50S ribosomal protein L24, partial [Planctomycetales bacterium]|nr:50S ribosomal protein L24 [Planctomycetales bacterium]
PLQISNVLLVCNRCGVGVRTGARLTSDGIKERFCRKCSTALGQIAPAKEKQAAK